MSERETFNFDAKELGIVSTEELIDAGENFLNSEPDNIRFVQKETEEEKAEKERKEKEEKEKKDKEKKLPVPPKDVIIKPEEIDAEDVLGDREEGEGEEVGPDGKKIDKKKPNPDGTASTDSDNIFSSIAKELFEQGVFSEEFDEEGQLLPVKEDLTPEEFLETFQRQTKKQAADIIDKFIGQFGEDYQDMFQNVFVNGVPPVDYLNRYTKIQNIEGLDLAQEDNQEKVVRELYRNEGRSAEYIDKKISQLKNYNDLLDEATEAKRILGEREAAEIKAAGERKQQEIARQAQIKNEYYNNVNKILGEKLKTKEFDGIPVDRKFADTIQGYLTKDKFQTPDKQLLTEFDKDILDLKRPENHEMKVKIAMLMQLLKTDPTLSTLAKKAVSKETNTLFKGLKKTASSTQTPTKDKDSKDDDQPKSWF